MRAFNPGLPRIVWLLQLGVLINFFGNGMVAPYLILYLHYGRNIPLGLAAAAVSLGGVTAVTSGLAAGSLADRIGPRNILVAAMICNATAYLLYTQVTVSWHAFLVGLLVGVGTGTYGPTSQALTASMVAKENRPAAFAQNRVTAIVGLGVGGVVGGFVAAGGLHGYLQLLVLDAVTFLLFAAVALMLPAGRVTSIAPTTSSGYVAVLRDRVFVRLVAINIALVSAGIAPMLVLLAAYAKGEAHIGTQAIGAIYAVNTLTIVVAQLPLTRFAQSRDRMHVLRTGSLLWVAFWLVALGAGAWLQGLGAAAVIGAAAVAYAVGECLYTAVMLPTAAALAPDHLRGRYLGAMGLAWQTGFLIGPTAGGAILSAYPLALPAVCATVCLVAAAGTGSLAQSLRPRAATAAA